MTFPNLLNGTAFGVAGSVIGVALGLLTDYQPLELIIRFAPIWLFAIAYTYLIEKKSLLSVGINEIDWIPLVILPLIGVFWGVWGVQLAAARVVQTGAEELFYRGWLSDRVGRVWGFWGGAIASSLLFTAMHGFNPGFGIIPALTMIAWGVAACGLRRDFNSIVPGIIIHTIVNLAVELL